MKTSIAMSLSILCVVIFDLRTNTVLPITFAHALMNSGRLESLQESMNSISGALNAIGVRKLCLSLSLSLSPPLSICSPLSLLFHFFLFLQPLLSFAILLCMSPDISSCVPLSVLISVSTLFLIPGHARNISFTCKTCVLDFLIIEPTGVDNACFSARQAVHHTKGCWKYMRWD